MWKARCGLASEDILHGECLQVHVIESRGKRFILRLLPWLNLVRQRKTHKKQPHYMTPAYSAQRCSARFGQCFSLTLRPNQPGPKWFWPEERKNMKNHKRRSEAPLFGAVLPCLTCSIGQSVSEAREVA